MKRHKVTTQSQLEEYKSVYTSRIKLAREVFGQDVFRIKGERGSSRDSPPLYDGVMVAIDRLWPKRAAIRKVKTAIRKKLAERIQKPKSKAYAIVVGRPNTAEAIRDRLELVTQVIRSCLR